MPRTKNTSKKEDPKAKVGPELMDFEDFVARKSSHSKKSYTGFYVLLIVLILGLSAFLVFDKKKNDKPITQSSYKIVYLDNNIVYYAKIAKEDAYNIYLSDVYYVDTQVVEKPATEEGAEPTNENVEVLKRRGDTNAGWLTINRQKVFGFEDLPADSEVMNMINNYK